MIERLALHLLRRHVRGGAEHLADPGHRLGRQLARLRPGLPRRQLGEPEVEDPDPALGVDHHVVGLEVAVGDAAVVGRAQGVGQRDGDLEELRQRHAPLGDQLAETAPRDELHGEEVDAVGLLDRVEVDDVRVVQGGEGPGLALEAVQPLAVRRQLRRQDLERHLAPQLGVLGPVDHPHPALTELVEDPIVSEGLADHAPPRPEQLPAGLFPQLAGCADDSNIRRRKRAKAG